MFSIIGGNGSASSQRNVNTSEINQFLFPTGEYVPVVWLILKVLRRFGQHLGHFFTLVYFILALSLIIHPS